MIKNNTKWFLILITLVLGSCNPDQFGVGKKNATISTTPVATGSTFVCSDFTQIRPPVDLLFIWDNSTSTKYISSSTKNALNNVINYISDRFDYQVMMAPLIGSGNSNSYFFSRAGSFPSGVSVIDKSNAASIISSFPSVSGNSESGAKRARDLLRTNISNGIFRQNSYTVVIIMSNEDDNSFVTGNYGATNSQKINYANGLSHDLLCLKGGYAGGSLRNSNSMYNSTCSNAPKLNSSMMRMLTIAPSYNCQSYFEANKVYRTMSQNIASAQGYIQTDFTDICAENYASIFDQVNSVIADQVIKHRYNYWPVAGSNVEIDPSTIVVTRDNGSPVFESSSSGFTYEGIQNNRDTRYFPTSGEPYTGHVIKLNGSAEIIYPSCLKVDYQAPRDYFGYCHIPNKPQESSIDVFIDGVKLSTSSWSLEKSSGNPKYTSNKNIKITSPSNFAPKTPGNYQSGYFVKLSANAVYSNAQTCNVTYLTSGN
ncbi:hypothetical protein A9Q84_08260 [Halobacteriovorax marinus]|uniref:VWFA domain-containing protein n=1 Tax=Halobacteriovorax marinus TaxID=97084 RepID=A0A1Y5FBI4_9BACT|nr:hypothetical protein A9Q84_08260 [Halobacteriovorax marinus]